MSDAATFRQDAPAWWRGQRARTIVVLLGLALDISAWGLTTAIEDNLAIVALHLLLLAACLPVVLAFEINSLSIFAVALLPRSLFTIAAWYSAFDDDRKFYVGTNDDPARFWTASSFPYDVAASAFEDPLFPLLNVFFTHVSRAIGNQHYLATTQTVLFAGALMAVFSSIFVQDLYGKRVGRLTGYLMALSPGAINYSTGLMRDALVGMFGFLLLLSLNRALTSRRPVRTLTMFVILIASALALAYLRSISLAAFVVAGYLTITSTIPGAQSRISSRSKYAVTAVLVAMLAFAAASRPDRFEPENVLSHAIASRADDGLSTGPELDESGLTTKIGNISPALFVLISPYAMMQPFPFYIWEAPYYIGGPPALMDVVLGFGGLYNQILFGFYIIALRHWLKRKDTFGFRVCFLFSMAICALTMVGLGATRMVMAHTYPFFFAGVSLAIVNVLQARPSYVYATLVYWMGCLMSLYLAYLAYKEAGSAVLAVVLLGTAAISAYRLWRMRLPRQNTARQPPAINERPQYLDAKA